MMTTESELWNKKTPKPCTPTVPLETRNAIKTCEKICCLLPCLGILLISSCSFLSRAPWHASTFNHSSNELLAANSWLVHTTRISLRHSTTVAKLMLKRLVDGRKSKQNKKSTKMKLQIFFRFNFLKYWHPQKSKTRYPSSQRRARDCFKNLPSRCQLLMRS